MGAMPMEMIRYERTTWTNIVRATRDDVETIRESYPHFHPLDLEDLLSRIERPKLDEYEDYLFTVMQFPIWDPLHRISRASEVDMFIGPSYLITAHDGNLPTLKSLFERCQSDEKARELYMHQGPSRLFHTIIDQLVDYIFPILYKVERNIREIEDEIFSRDTRAMIQDIAFIRRDNIALRRIVRPQVEIIANLERTERPFMHEDLEVYFGDIRDHLTKATDLISDHTEVIVGLADTANTLANYRTNEVVQILTVISVIMMPLTLISGIYGMNTWLPAQQNPVTFAGIIGLMLLIVFMMLAYFRYRRWL